MWLHFVSRTCLLKSHSMIKLRKLQQKGINLDDYENLLPISEIAKRLRVSMPTVRKLIRDKELEAYVIGGHTKVSERQFERYMLRALTTGR